MPLHLAIENETSLPDGGPVSITVTAKRGIDIGRDQYLDWVLPDPTRFVSGKHCEIRFKDGDYWITDVSTNGTFVNRSEYRLDRPHRLQSGDRIEIGHYVVAVRVEPDDPSELRSVAPAQERQVGDGSLWSVGDDAAAAIDPRDLKTPIISGPIGGFDVLDWATDIPAPPASPAVPSPAAGPMSPQRDALPTLSWADEDDRVRLPAKEAAAASEPLPVAAPLAEPAGQKGASDEAPAVKAEATFDEPAALPYMRTARPASVDSSDGSAATRRPGETSDVLARFAKGLGLPREAVSARDEGDLAELLGTLMRGAVDNIRQLDLARVQAKGMMRSANQTMIKLADNNPFRFCPSTEEALKVLFGPQTPSYMGPEDAFESSFRELKRHQVAFFGAMQQAVAKLLDDMDPSKIEAMFDDKKNGGLFSGSKKNKMWEHYVTVWNAKSGGKSEGMLAIFMLLFSDSYDKN